MRSGTFLRVSAEPKRMTNKRRAEPGSAFVMRLGEQRERAMQGIASLLIRASGEAEQECRTRSGGQSPAAHSS